jgi:hypothetical protein
MIQKQVFPETGKYKFIQTAEYGLNAVPAGEIGAPGMVHQAVAAVGIYQSVNAFI